MAKDRDVRRFSRKANPELLSVMRALGYDHAFINGDRLTDGQFEKWYARHHTHMLDDIESYYQGRLLAGMPFAQFRTKFTTVTPLDFIRPGEQKEIALTSGEIDHIVNHMAAWYVRDRRIARLNSRGETGRARSLERIWDSDFQRDLDYLAEGRPVERIYRRRRKQPEYR